MRPSGLICVLAMATCSCGTRDVGQAQTHVWDTWEASTLVGDTADASSATIGTVGATAITRQGHVLVLDGAEFRVLAFDTTGQLLARSSGAGDGPGELRDPIAISLTAEDSVLVVDRSLRRIELFAPVDDGLQPSRSVSLDFSPGAACVLGGDLFVLGNLGGDYLHRLSASLDLVNSFSPVADDSQAEQQDGVVAFRRFALGSGHLACDEHLKLLVHVPDSDDQMYGLAPDGRLVWTQRIDSLVPPVKSARAGGVRFDLDPAYGYAERVVRVTSLGAGQAQVLISRSFARDAQREPELRAIIIDVSSGSLVAREKAPHHFGAVTDEWAAEHLEEPTPAVRLWRK